MCAESMHLRVKYFVYYVANSDSWSLYSCQQSTLTSLPLQVEIHLNCNANFGFVYHVSQVTLDQA